MIRSAYDDGVLQDVEIRHLQALLAVAREGSFGRAAERLGFTQSAISQQIAGLERAVGDKVFDRPGGPRPVELTPIGEVLVGHAEAVLARIQQADDELRALRSGEIGRLVVGTFQSVSVKVLPVVIGRLRAERPGLTIRAFEHEDNEVLIERVRAGDLDLTFIVGDPGHDDLDLVELCTDPFVLVAPPNTPSLVPITDLAGQPLIGQQASACQVPVDDGLRAAGVEPDYVFRTNDNAAVQAMVRAGMGRAILPYLATDPQDPAITIAHLDPPIPPRVIFLARRRGRSLPPAANRFIEVAVDVCATLSALAPA
jgi:DNA-binding transcriptional LysR family regulator